MIKRILIIILTFFSIIIKAYGQSYYFNHYEVEHGLSHNTVLSSLQDRNGFIWFGTSDGLNRFDGYTFKVFKHARTDPNSIGNNKIHSLHEDKRGIIWIGTNEGMFTYNPLTENFIRFKEAGRMEIIDINIDQHGVLWFISDFTLNSFNFESKQLRTYNKESFFHATSICITERNELWIGTVNGKIQKYNRSTNTFKAFDVFSKSKVTDLKYITKIIDSNKGFLLIGTAKQGLKSFNLSTSNYKDLLSFDENHLELYVRNIIQYSKDEFWIASENGIYIYNLKDKKFKNLKKQYNNPWYISDNAIYSLLKDDEGGLWAGTYFGGINYFPKGYTPFKKYFPMNGANSLSGNAVREIHPDNYGNLWIGTEDGGLNKLNLESGAFSHYKSSGIASETSNNNIHGLLVTGDTLWIGSFEQGLDLMNIKTGKNIQHFSSPKSFQSNFIYDIIQTSNDQIILATGKGLYKYNSRNSTFSVIKNVPDYLFYTSIFEDSKGNIWVGTLRDGLYTFNLNSDTANLYKHETENINSLSNNRINSIFEDSYKNIWIATEGGLCKLDKNGQTFKTYSTENNFPSNLIYSILEDNNLNLWITTSKGLVFLNPVTEEQQVFTVANGLLSDQFNYNSSYKAPDGRIYFGSVKGMISFNPNEFLRDTYIPSVFITGFQVYNQELEINRNGSPLTKSITFTDTVILKSNQSSFSIDFAALSFTSPKMTNYVYKMEGLDKDWTYLNTNRKAFFTKLPPGNYTFRVNAYNSSKSRQGKEAKLVIQILPPFWKSSLAYFIYFITGSLLIFYVMQHIKQKNQRKLILMGHQKEKDLYNAKIDFFTNIAHEIRTPLTLIKGPMEKIIKKSEEIPAIKNNLIIMERNTDRLLELTNQLLDFRKTEKDGFMLSFLNVNISEVLTSTFSLFKSAAEQKNIEFKLYIPSTPVYGFIDNESFQKIISNLLNNAIKYAESKILVILKYKENDKYFEIEFKNDGTIIPNHMKDKIFDAFFRLNELSSSLGSGLGLALVRSLTHLNNGTITLKESEEKLNVFILHLPIHQNNEYTSDTSPDKNTINYE